MIERRITDPINYARLQVRPHKDHRGVDLISDALPFGRLWYDGPTPPAMQSGTQAVTAGHMTRDSRLR